MTICQDQNLIICDRANRFPYLTPPYHILEPAIEPDNPLAFNEKTMSITGCLADFSISEIFQLIEKGQKTGFLAVSALPEDITPYSDIHYIWFYRGRIIAAANRLDHQCLAGLIAKNQAVSKRAIAKIVRLCPKDKPLGLSLKDCGVLSDQKLKQIFQIQVLQRLRTLLEFEDGVFKFIQNAPIPMREMTGLNVRATEGILIGLRLVQNWNGLVDKLPDPNASLAPTIFGLPPYPLNHRELRVWEYGAETISLTVMAKKMGLPVNAIQKIAFTLIAVGLVEEVSLVPDVLSTQTFDVFSTQSSEKSGRKNISFSFLHTLLDLLRSKVSHSLPIASAYTSPSPDQKKLLPVDSLSNSAIYS